jgi:FKBP-type peptidyl-prolyl cis-trans isomerase FkpA
LRYAFALLVLAVAAGCASPQESKTTTAAPPARPVAAAPRSACASPPSELVVKDVQPGTGQAIRFRSAVSVHYTGWLYDGCARDFKGAKFDSSLDRNVPFGVMVGAGRVIRGWDEGLIGLKEGGKRLLVIPPDKAYGSRQMGDKIPPNSTLVFEIELQKILNQPPAQ